jgi:hypothetical protein
MPKIAKGISPQQSLGREALSQKDLEGLLCSIREVEERLAEVQGSALRKVKASVGEIGVAAGQSGDDVVDYLECKQQILLAYCQNLVFYLMLKAQGRSVKEHPVMNQMLELRYVLEKMRPIDGKLHYQIDRLIKLSTLDEKEAELASLRPNPLALLAKDDDDDDDNDEEEEEEDDGNDDDEEDENEDEDNEDDDDRGKGKKVRRQDREEKYRAPRMAAVPFKESENEQQRREKRLLKARRRLKNSEILDALREEFSSAPEYSSSTGVSGMSGEAKRLAAEEQERRDYEEDRFVRMTMSRKDKHSIKRRQAEAQRIDNMNEIGDFDDLEELNKLVGREGGGSKQKKVGFADDFAGGGGGSSNGGRRRTALASGEGTSTALKKALKTFQMQATGGKNPLNSKRQKLR